MTTTPLEARNATLADLAEILTIQQDHRVPDTIVPATAIRSVGGTLVIDGMGPDGPVGEAGMFQPTEICDGQLADKLGIPTRYLRTLRADRVDLFDANVNGWLHGQTFGGVVLDEPDSRRFLVRAFAGQDGGVGVARAVLSNSYQVIDNFDVLTAALDAIRDTGYDVEFPSVDLSERRMVVKITAPEISAVAPKILRGYRSPFTGQSGDEIPVVEAGLVLSNGETGGTAFTVLPRFRFRVCDNGMCITKDAVREIHLGSKLDEGVIRWSDSTHRQNLDLIRAKTADAVRTFLDVDYMTKVLDDLAEKAGAPVADAVKTIEVVGSALRYTEEERTWILDHFIKGGQLTAGGIMQAVTSFAQTLASPDDAWEMELSALRALDLAAA